MDVMGTYARLWAVVWFLFLGVNMIFGSTEAPVPIDLLSGAFLASVCLAGLTAWAPVIVVAHILSLLHLIKQLPGVFDGDCWSGHHDLSFVLAALYVKWPTITTLSWTDAERDAVVHTAAPLMRAQLILFYGAAFFWKLCTGFFDPVSSCPTIFLMQQLSQWWWPVLGEPPDWLVQLAAWSAPYLTELVEGGVAIGFLFPGWFTAAGVALGLQLHMLIAITPPPHNIGGYGLRCAVRYFFLMPEAVAQCEGRLLDAATFRAPWPTVGAAAAAIASIAAVGSVAKWQIPGGPLIDDFMIPAFYAMTLYLGASLASYASSIWNGTMAANPTARPHWTLKAFIICEGLAFCYGLPLLGLAENFAPKPFANLRVHGGNGTNHFFAPTNLGASLGIPIPSQEVVRVESTTSDRLNALWPAEMSFYLNDGHTRQLLEQVGHSGRIFGPAAARLIGPAFVTPNSPGEDFIRYTVPAFELRRALAEARAAGEAFSLVYTRLTVPYGNPNTATGPQVVLEEDGQGGSKCLISTTPPTASSSLAVPCSATEAAVAEPPPWWALKFAVFWATPVLEDTTEEKLGYCQFE